MKISCSYRPQQSSMASRFQKYWRPTFSLDPRIVTIWHDCYSSTWKTHTNADALSRIPDSIEYCGNYTNNVDVPNLPCHPCTFCSRAHNQWSRFFNDVDYVVPLSIRKIKLSTDILYHKENWGTKHSSEDLKKFQENDPNCPLFLIGWNLEINRRNLTCR